MKSEERYYFDKDDSGHNYIIPLSKRKLWEDLELKMANADPHSDEYYKFENQFNEEFDKYRTGYGPRHYSFTDLKEIE